MDRLIERTILAMLERRAAGATICPSEVARRVGDEGWRDLMDLTRAAARRLAVGGLVEITQGGRVTDEASAKGPIRIRLVRDAEDPSSPPPVGP